MPSPSNRPTLTRYLSREFAVHSAFFTWNFSQYWGGILAWKAQHANISPNTITTLSLLTSILGTVFYVETAPTVWGTLGICLLWQLGYALDCADGQLARATEQKSRFGAWYDPNCDILTMAAITAACAAQLVTQGMPVFSSIGAASLLAAGFAINVSTASRLRQDPNSQRLSGAGLFQLLKAGGTTITDRPVVIVLLCFGRHIDWLLLATLWLLGLLFCAYASVLGWKHFR